MIQQGVLFYLLWFGCVFASKSELGLWVYLFPLVGFLAVRFGPKGSPTAWYKLFLLGLLGIAFDSLALKLGWIVLADNLFPEFAPHWLVALWIVFALALPLYLPWFQKRLWLASVLGAITGPLSYAGGEKLDVLSFGNQAAVIYYAVFWALYMPVAIGWLRHEGPQQKNLGLS